MIGTRTWPLVDAARMRALDAHTIDVLGVPGDVLMESAGREVCAALLAEYADALDRDSPVIVLCGAGNNGGDGLVVARHLRLAGHSVRVALLADPDRLSGDAATNYARVVACGVPVDGGSPVFPARGVVVDAVFGTGLTRPIEGAIAEAIEAANASGLPIVAVDLPSGLDTDTGQVLGIAVRADLTVAISAPKRAHALEPGRSHSGRVLVARIGIVDALPDDAPDAPAVQVWTERGAGRALPARPVAGHKGRFGHVLVIAGSEGKTGAAALSARAAGRAGAGLVTVACPRSLNDILEIKCTEAMTAPVAETAGRSFGKAALSDLLELAAQRDVVALGPGIGTEPETVALVRDLVAALACPLVLDADALNALAGDVGCLRDRAAGGAPCVLTPHPGEAARLLGCAAAEVNRDRIASARALARQSGAVVLLKGAGTVAADPDGAAFVNPTGGPSLATGGTGDVLTGIVAALLAQGVGGLEAASLAAYWHGAAGDQLEAWNGGSGLLAGDLTDVLPAVGHALRTAGAESPAADVAAGMDEDGAARAYGPSLLRFP